jgi:hypothetical protein
MCSVPERHYGDFALFGNQECAWPTPGAGHRPEPSGGSAYNQVSGMKTLRLTVAGRLG